MTCTWTKEQIQEHMEDIWKTAKEQGRTIMAITNEKDIWETERQGKTDHDMFFYTVGHHWKGLPDLLLTYPSTTVAGGLNEIGDKLFSGELVIPENGDWIDVPCEHLVYRVRLLSGQRLKYAHKKFTRAVPSGSPIALVWAPLPNGEYHESLIPAELMPGSNGEGFA